MDKNNMVRLAPEQLAEHKRALQQDVLWCLFYREEEFAAHQCKSRLDPYMTKLQDRLCGLNLLLGYPKSLCDALEMLAAAQCLYRDSVQAGEFEPTDRYQRFRKYILDARGIIGRLTAEPALEGDADGPDN